VAEARASRVRPATATAVPEAARLCRELSRRLEAAFVQAGLVDRTVALLDWPHHTNSGDSAIWVGELQVLRRLGNRLVHRCGQSDYDPEQIRSCLGREGVVLLHGGGSFGDVYPATQRFRERVLRDLVTLPVVQLPQSLHFQDPAAERTAAAAVSAHPDFTLLVRDDESRARAEQLGARTLLSPDAAFGVHPVRERPTRHERLWLLRSDGESSNVRHVPDPLGIRIDWPGTGEATYVPRAIDKLLAHRRLLSRALGHGEPVLERAMDRLAQRRLDRGLALLGQGAVVITDRLHGHILSTLLGRPHVLLDNRIGKIGNFHATWTKDVSFVRFASSSEAALYAAEELADLHRRPKAA